ncbi:MAG: NnrS family protein [Gammaproteobacteria bacterium]
MQSNKVSNTRTRIPAQRLFFPAAALYAAILLPLSMANLLGIWTWPEGLYAGHGREMLFGFVLALVAGYLLGPQPRVYIYTIFTLWLSARLAALLVPESLAAGILELAFLLTVIWIVIPRLLAAKKWRNRSIAPLVFVLFLLPVGYQFLMGLEWLEPGSVLLFGIILLSLLMLFMGGRIIAAAAAGEIQRRGGHLVARVQPPLEAALIVLVIPAAVISLIPGWRILTGSVLLLVGLVAGVRMTRWRLWKCRRADLLALAVGYFWLVAGLFTLGLALITGSGYSGVLHMITIGALGTLSITIAARVHLVNLKRADTVGYFFIITTLLITVATLLRLVSVYVPDYAIASLWVATAAWSLSYLLLLAVLIGILSPN